MTQPTALVVGVGAEQGVGAAVSRRFAAEGFHVLVAGRTQAKVDQVVATIKAAGGSAQAIVADATQEDQVIALFDRAMAPGAGFDPVSVVVSNAGDNRPIPFREVTAELFEAFWRVGCFSGFLVGREAARRMVPLGRGTMIFTGASGSLRGKAQYAQFAAAKAGLRMISQSMAREFGPKGLHVAHVVVDGGIDGARLKNAIPEIVAARGQDGLLGVDAIAEMYWQIHRQPPSAWTQELDLRPFKEAF
ncbi:SDR family NAD(P)-dependent oxidoreductase [Phenylobacterium sp.]|uniref:SDR family NAD(P)-dependent oxidoreductase n=1 Tax=Phenylobacterium sp. TaxID=1871053 RepID=UPI0030F3E53F